MEQNRRTHSPITDAVYGRKRKPQRPAKPRKEVNPRHTFGIAGRLDPATRWKLERIGRRGSKHKKGAK